MAQATFQPEQKIKLVVTENPKREGTESHKRFQLYRKAQTVADFLAKGGRRADLTWDSERGYIKVTAPQRRKTDKLAA